MGEDNGPTTTMGAGWEKATDQRQRWAPGGEGLAMKRSVGMGEKRMVTAYGSRQRRWCVNDDWWVKAAAMGGAKWRIVGDKED